jgi:membrane-associated phospholipid phosphatase
MASIPAERAARPVRLILLVLLVLLPLSFPLDGALSRALVAWRPPGVEPLAQLATRLGHGMLTIGLPCVIGLIWWWRGRRAPGVRGLLAGATVAGAGLLELLVKELSCRGRPTAADAGAFFSRFPCNPTDYAHASFPSGHATTAFALAALLALWYPRWAAGFLALAGLVALSRVVLGAHFPSDVLAGAALGTAVALIVHAKVPGIRLSA